MKPSYEKYHWFSVYLTKCWKRELSLWTIILNQRSSIQNITTQFQFSFIQNASGKLLHQLKHILSQKELKIDLGLIHLNGRLYCRRMYKMKYTDQWTTTSIDTKFSRHSANHSHMCRLRKNRNFHASHSGVSNFFSGTFNRAFFGESVKSYVRYW